MEIREQTPERLVIYSQPIGIGIFLSLFVAGPLYMLVWNPEIPELPLPTRWFAIPFILFAGWALSTLAAVITCQLDRTTQTVTIEQKYLFATKTITQPLTAITKVEINRPDTEGTPMYPVYLHFRSGEKYPVYSCFSVGLINQDWLQEQHQVATTIQQFLAKSV